MRSVKELIENEMFEVGPNGLWKKKLLVQCESPEAAADLFGPAKAAVGSHARLDGSYIVMDEDDQEQFSTYIQASWDNSAEGWNNDLKKWVVDAIPEYRFVRE